MNSIIKKIKYLEIITQDLNDEGYAVLFEVD